MFIENSYIPSPLNVVLKTSFFRVSLMVGIGVGSLASSEKSDL